MTLLETPRFAKLRKKLRDEDELAALKTAVAEILNDPIKGKKLKGELAHLRSHRFTVRGQSRRLVYHFDSEVVTLFSFGPRQGIYK
jgi:mRNA-degrading endonuclease RelE of RelBE toxin-antitoxin system